jgi:phospholipid transport system transporter-binding protein
VFAGSNLVVDLSGVSEVDSSALSLLLEWQRTARAAGRVIAFTHLPANLKSLADLYGVSELLGVA